MFIVYATLVLLHVHLAFCQEHWVDPHAMDVRSSQLSLASSSSPPHDTSNHDCAINFSMAHYKRLINLLLNAVAVDRSDLESFKGQLYINIPLEKYDFLRNFVRSSETTEDPTTLRQIDQILSKILTKNIHEHIGEVLVSWMDYIYFTFYNRTAGIFIACMFALSISYKLLRANLTIWSVAKYLIFLGWIIDFAFTWINLLQEAEINKMADSIKYRSMPAHCDPSKMSYWQYFVDLFSSSSDCRNYHQTLYKDSFWSIAPVTVLSHQLGIIIYTPASHIGQALGNFTSGLLGTLPWGVNIILLPVLLIFSAVVMCIMFSFITQTTFSFNLLHLIQLKFGGEERQIVGDVLTGRNLTALITMVHRSMIEDVRQPDSSENSCKLEDSNCSRTDVVKCQNPVKEVSSNLADENIKQSDSVAITDSIGDKELAQDNTIATKSLHDGSGDK